MTDHITWTEEECPDCAKTVRVGRYGDGRIAAWASGKNPSACNHETLLNLGASRPPRPHPRPDPRRGRRL